LDKKVMKSGIKGFFLLAILHVCFMFNQLNAQMIPAFPGAVGFGSHTPGGRGGRVIDVTNLNDRGPGSFRAACEAEGPRIIIFRTGGIITLKNIINIDHPYITIAGQTAPGDGICIRGAALVIRTHDVIVRGMRFRVGDNPDGPDPENRDALNVDNKNGGVRNVVIDHCSISWSTDENFSIWYDGASDITISNSIISEALYRSLHPKGGHSMGAVNGQGVRNISYIGNLWAHNHQRNPRIQGEVAFVNNVVYNRSDRDVDIGESANPETGVARVVSVVGNWFLKGPSFTRNSHSVNVRNCPPGSAVFVADNISTYNTDQIYNSNPIMVNSPSIWPLGFKAKSSDDVLEWVLANAGAIAPRRDPVDVRIVNDVRNGTGGIVDCVGPGETIQHQGIAQDGSTSTAIKIAGTSKAETYALIGYKIAITSGKGAGQSRTIMANDKATKIVTVSPGWDVIPDASSKYKIYNDCIANAGGWPNYSTGTPLADKDKDGIPDEWEIRHGLDPNNPSDGNKATLSAEGYTNIEVYINSLFNGSL
jgi:hypothetical protein